MKQVQYNKHNSINCILQFLLYNHNHYYLILYYIEVFISNFWTRIIILAVLFLEHQHNLHPLYYYLPASGVYAHGNKKMLNGLLRNQEHTYMYIHTSSTYNVHAHRLIYFMNLWTRGCKICYDPSLG